MKHLDKYQQKHQRRPKWQSESPKLEKTNLYQVPEETVNDAIDMIGGDEQAEYKIKCL